MKKILFLSSLIILCFFGKAQTDDRGPVPTPMIIGTDNCQPLILKTNDIERVFLSKYGALVGIGNNDPSAVLDLFYNVGPNCTNVPYPVPISFPMIRMSAPILSGNFTTYLNTDNGAITMQQSSNANLSIFGYNKDNSIIFEKTGALSLKSTQGKLTITPDGTVLVNGLLCAKEMRVQLAGAPCWPDFVFSKDYKLLPLKDVEQFITENQHLPNVPSSADVEANGVELGEMNAILLQKVEELTLYIIQLEKRLAELENKKGGE